MIEIKLNCTDQTFFVHAIDAISGQPRAGLTAADVTACHVRTRSAPVPITPVALSSADAAHNDGGFIEVDAVCCRGLYRFDAPDAAFAEGAESVVIILQADDALLATTRVRLVGAAPGDIQAEVHLCKAMLANTRIHTISTGVDEIKDDDGTTTIRTMTPSFDGDDTITVTPS